MLGINLPENTFVAVRMIILNDDQQATAFETFVKDKLRPAMFESFPDLQGFVFLKGNRNERQPSNPTRAKSIAAGSNADYAWMTFWENWQANRDAWRGTRAADWKAIWNDFLSYCYPKDRSGDQRVIPPKSGRRKFVTRPAQGPAYDYLGRTVDRGKPDYFGKGAGCLVEGFTVIHSWPKPK